MVFVNYIFRYRCCTFGFFKDKGASTTVYAATAPELEGIGGKYLDVVKISNPSPKALNEETAKKLWDVSEQMLTKWKESDILSTTEKV